MTIRIQYEIRGRCVLVYTPSSVLYRVPDEHSDQRMWAVFMDELRRFKVRDCRRGYFEYADNATVRSILDRFLFKFQ